MKILQDFLKNINNEDIIKSSSIIYDFYSKNKKLIPNDEREDFQQDIILTVLKANKKYDNTKGTFGTYLIWSFKTLKQNIISKYTGIKMNYYQYINNFKKEGCPIKILTIKE